jgi:hypothetical protein
LQGGVGENAWCPFNSMDFGHKCGVY